MIKVDIYQSLLNFNKFVAVKSGTDPHAFATNATDPELKQLRWFKQMWFGRGKSAIMLAKGNTVADSLVRIQQQGWTYL